MEKNALLSDESWPNLEFFLKYGTSFVQSYGWGKFVISEYLKL